MQVKVRKAENAQDHAACAAVLRGLPDWFGIESSNLKYIEQIKVLPTCVAELDGKVIGFMTIEEHFPETSEIIVTGVLPEFHHQGVGTALLDKVIELMKSKGQKLLEVKTLSDAHPDKGYAVTREFYLRKGFIPLEEMKELWDKNNPALILVKVIA